MKHGIHPSYARATVTCACGNSFTVGSTKSEIHTEVCSACHPFYTGQKKLMDSAGRVERFTRLVEKTQTKKSAQATTKKERHMKKATPQTTKLG